MIHITNHAILRYQERVAPVSTDEARTALSSRAIHLAAEIGCEIVRPSCGQRIIIQNRTVITVLPAMMGRKNYPLHRIREI